MVGELMSYYYNSKASVSNTLTGEVRLPDDVDTYVMGIKHNGPQTTEWVTRKVNCISYFTYRNRLPKPLSNGGDHDAGWGCMIRTGQMMFMECLQRIFDRSREQEKMRRQGSEGASSADGPPTPLTREGSQILKESNTTIRTWFQDLPDAPFGLHALSDAGAKYHIPVGEWFNPTCLSHCLVELSKRFEPVNEVLKVVHARDGLVVRGDILDTLAGLDEGGPRNVLLLIPLMLGAGGILTQQYHDPVTRCFRMPNTMGIVGGKPKMSLYFVGHQGDNVFYLDPHVVQPAFVKTDTPGNIIGPRGTCKVSTLDSCLLLCFLFHSVTEFCTWEHEFKEVINPLTDYPMFSIADKALEVDDSMMYMEDSEGEDGDTEIISRPPPPAAVATATEEGDDDFDNGDDVEESALPKPVDPHDRSPVIVDEDDLL